MGFDTSITQLKWSPGRTDVASRLFVPDPQVGAGLVEQPDAGNVGRRRHAGDGLERDGPGVIADGPGHLPDHDLLVLGHLDRHAVRAQQLLGGDVGDLDGVALVLLARVFWNRDP